MDTTIAINGVALGVILTLLGIIVAILIALGVIKPLPTAKERMKKKILKKLDTLSNKDCVLVAETYLRDMIYWDHLARKPLLKKRFFSLFIESIGELIDSKSIIPINRGELFCPYPHPAYKDDIDPFPPYESRIPKTPSDYSLKKCDPDMYIGRNTTKCEECIKSYKARAAAKLEQINKHY